MLIAGKIIDVTVLLFLALIMAPFALLAIIFACVSEFVKRVELHYQYAGNQKALERDRWINS